MACYPDCGGAPPWVTAENEPLYVRRRPPVVPVYFVVVRRLRARSASGGRSVGSCRNTPISLEARNMSRLVDGRLRREAGSFSANKARQWSVNVVVLLCPALSGVTAGEQTTGDARVCYTTHIRQTGSITSYEGADKHFGLSVIIFRTCRNLFERPTVLLHTNTFLYFALCIQFNTKLKYTTLFLIFILYTSHGPVHSDAV